MRQGEDVLIKVLETVDGNTIIYVKMGDADARAASDGNGCEHDEYGRPADALQTQSADFRDKAESVGTESITVPAGTFTCEHYRMKDGSGDAWISDKVCPWGLVKMQENKDDGSGQGDTDAKDHITGTPKKFDPMQMMRGSQQGQQPQ